MFLNFHSHSQIYIHKYDIGGHETCYHSTILIIKCYQQYNSMPKEKFPKFSDDESDNISLGDEAGEIIEVDPDTFKAKEKGKPELDESEFVFHPEDGSVSYKLDKDGCQKGY